MISLIRIQYAAEFVDFLWRGAMTRQCVHHQLAGGAFENDPKRSLLRDATRMSLGAAGSYMVEALTNEMERGFYDYKRKIDALGGMLPAIYQGYPMKEIADASFRFQEEMDSKSRIMVGANEYVENEPLTIPILAIDPKGYERQCQRLARLRLERDNEKTSAALEKLRSQALLGHENMMPHLIDCCNAYATLGEIAGVLRKVYGEHKDPSIV